MKESLPKVAFVTNFCPHYRVATFHLMSKYLDVDFYFFSRGGEWYWLPEHGIREGGFKYTYLPGFRIGGTYITPSLVSVLYRGNHEVFISGIVGRFAMPITYLMARLKRRPFILWTGIWMRLQTRAHRLLFPLTRYIYRHADALVVYGEHVKRYLISEGVPAERIFIAAHAVDNALYSRPVSEEEKEALRRELRLEADQRMVLYLGRLETIKGLDYLVEAFAALKGEDTVLVLAGTGSEQAHLEQLIRQKGLTTQVRFPGYIPPEKTLPYYATAWVYVLPSITMPTGKETWGLVVNEAFNQGLPVIATEAVGAAAGGLVQDGINGFVVPERDSAALAQALQRILDDPDLRARMGQKAREIIATWDNERMVMGFRQAVEYVLSRKAKK